MKKIKVDKLWRTGRSLTLVIGQIVPNGTCIIRKIMVDMLLSLAISEPLPFRKGQVIWLFHILTGL